MEILDESGMLDSEYSSVSITVVDENALIAGGENQHIVSYLFLDSELKGYIESPADFFVDDKEISSQEKLNLLMLTHGWSRYLWSESVLNADYSGYHKRAGITIKGKAKRLNGKKPIVNGNITVGLFTDRENIFMEGQTDSAGCFSLDSLYFFDTVPIFVQALNEKGKRRTEVMIETIKADEPPISFDMLDAMQHIPDIPLQHYRQKYYSDVEYREYHPDDGSIMLEEITITREKARVDDGHFRLYHRADQVITVTEKDRATNSSLLQFLQGRVAGLYIDGAISIRGSSSITRPSTPLILLDGVPIFIDSSVSIGTSIQNVDKVEVLKGTSAAVYGSRGANGVIAIYTRKGKVAEVREAELVGAIIQRVAGFSSCREFYSPRYTPNNIDSPAPDHRTTLYWDPDITTENGKAELSFFTADDLGYYRIIVEGISNDGHIYLGSAGLVVALERKP